MAQHSIKKNFIMNALLTMSSFLFPIITFPYVSRVLLPAGTGRVQFAVAFVAYFDMFAQLGIPTYGVRACARVRDDREKLSRMTHELLTINLVMALVAYLALSLCMVFVPRVRADWPLFAVVSITIVLNAIGMEWLYRALEQYSYITVRSILFKAVSVVFMFLLIHSPEDYLLYGGITIFASSASNILNFINARKYVSVRPMGGYRFHRHWKSILIFFAMSCSITVYTNLDAVMLGFITTDADVGYYLAAVKIKNILVSLVTALGTVLLPRASYYIERGHLEEFHRITTKALHFVIIAATPLALFFILFAREGILFLSGTAYLPSVLPMQIIMPTVLLIGITNVLGIQILVPLGKEKVVLYSVIAGALVDLIINALLIPRFASSGAAIGTLVAEFVVFVVQYIHLRSSIRPFLQRFPAGKVLCGLVLGCLCSIWVKRLDYGVFVHLLIAGVLFMGCYGLTLLALKDQLVTEIWGQIRKKVFRH